jgi:predicted enzyme related to lactoylglutathione lyase
MTSTQESTPKSALGYVPGLTCALNVRDLNRGIAFYRDVLGFKLLYQMDEMGWCELETEVPGVNVGLSQVEEAGGKGGATLTFGVADIERSRSQLEAKGISFDGPTQVIEGMVKLATFYDPDGNALMFYQSLG